MIDGTVPLDQLFEVLNKQVDPLILAHGDPSQPSNWKRPFLETPTANPVSISTSVTENFDFMEEDETMGEIGVIWLGPSPTDFRTNLGLKILGDYLTYSATSPLSQAFIEIPKPMASDISFDSQERTGRNELWCTISDVPTKHLQTLPETLMQELRSILQEGIEMDRMASMLRRDKRSLLELMESRRSRTLSSVFISDFLYGQIDGQNLPDNFADLEDYAALDNWTSEEWLSLLNQCVSIAACS